MAEPEVNPFQLVAASRGRFLRDPKGISEKVRRAVQFTADKGHTYLITQAIMECPAVGLFRGLSVSVKVTFDIHQLIHLPSLLPFHLIQIRPQPEGKAQMTLSGPVPTLAGALWEIHRDIPEGALKEALSPLLWGFNQLLAQEFQEESLYALQCLQDKFAISHQ